MKVRRSIVAAGAAVVLGTTGALALPAMASAHNASTTLKFTAVTVKRAAFTKTNFGLQETDVNGTGKTIGFDDVNYAITGPSSGTAGVAFDTKRLPVRHGHHRQQGHDVQGQGDRGDRAVQGSDRDDHRQGNQ